MGKSRDAVLEAMTKRAPVAVLLSVASGDGCGGNRGGDGDGNRSVAAAAGEPRGRDRLLAALLGRLPYLGLGNKAR